MISENLEELKENHSLVYADLSNELFDFYDVLNYVKTDSFCRSSYTVHDTELFLLVKYCTGRDCYRTNCHYSHHLLLLTATCEIVYINFI